MPPSEGDIFSEEQLVDRLASLVTGHPLVPRWLFKLPEHVQGKGFGRSLGQLLGWNDRNSCPPSLLPPSLPPSLPPLPPSPSPSLSLPPSLPPPLPPPSPQPTVMSPPTWTAMPGSSRRASGTVKSGPRSGPRSTPSSVCCPSFPPSSPNTPCPWTYTSSQHGGSSSLSS